MTDLIKHPQQHSETKSTVLRRFLATGWDVTPNGCWEWRGSRAVRGGYGQINDKGKLLKAHRVAYEHFKSAIGPGLLVRHTCDNPPCVNPAHLLSGTSLDNARDAASRGRVRHQVMTGTYCPASKLTWSSVLEIRASAEPLAVLAARYGVSRSAVSQVRRGKTWKEPGSVRTQRSGE